MHDLYVLCTYKLYRTYNFCSVGKRTILISNYKHIDTCEFNAER